MKRISLYTIALIIMLGMFEITSCKKESNTNNDTQSATITMHLKDGPGHYDAVWLNIQRVEVTMEGHNSVSLTPYRTGMYDILRFRNGMDTLLLRSSFPPGKVNQIRLILGDGNAVVVDGVTEPLTTPSAQESGLKINLKETFEAGRSYDIWLDFDATKSIHTTGSGKYMLKPVIRAYSTLTDGRIKGYVLPAAAFTTVYLSNGTDIYTAIVAPDGFFMITGIPEGTYQVTYDAALPAFIDITLNNVQVKYGATLDLGTTVLIQ